MLRIRKLKETTLAKKVYMEQKSLDWPGLVKETRDICSKLEIEDVNETEKDDKDLRR